MLSYRINKMSIKLDTYTKIFIGNEDWQDAGNY